MKWFIFEELMLRKQMAGLQRLQRVCSLKSKIFQVQIWSRISDDKMGLTTQSVCQSQKSYGATKVTRKTLFSSFTFFRYLHRKSSFRIQSNRNFWLSTHTSATDHELPETKVWRWQMDQCLRQDKPRNTSSLPIRTQPRSQELTPVCAMLVEI